MHDELQQILNDIRRQRNFDPSIYIQAKASLLNEYLRRSSLSACIVAVSGGIDSAVTLGIVKHASLQADSPIRRLIAALVPIFSTGATHQVSATQRGVEVAQHLQTEHITIDLTLGLSAIKESVDASSSIYGGDWAAGQLVSYLRTPALYYLSSLLAQEGFASIVCGTTNRDEGSYLGFFGKASDAMVDLQVISDLHKSEVYAVARHLQLPESILDAVPTGDTFDGKSDEEMIGAPYDFIELYTALLSASAKPLPLREESSAELQRYADCVEALHQKNLHKYLSGSQAVHLDLYERAVPGGWEAEPLLVTARPAEPFLGEFTLQTQLSSEVREVTKTPLDTFGESAFLLGGVFTDNECEQLFEEISRQTKLPVGQDGRRVHFDPKVDRVGSLRASFFDEEFAALLWRRISPRVSSLRVMQDDTPTDWGDHRVWRPIGVNPLFRCLWYEPGGLVIPHYDAGFDFGDSRRHTLMSVIIYLTEAQRGQGGATRFLHDPQSKLPLAAREYRDQPREVEAAEVRCEVLPQPGAALCFDHRILHDGAAWKGPGVKLLLRTDLIFERCAIDILRRLPAKQRETPLRDASRGGHDVSVEMPPHILRQIQRDVYYSLVYQNLGAAAVYEAGFLEDKAPIRDNPRAAPRWFSTPLEKLRQRATSDKPLAVLISTGAFCPPHEGHLEMMELARQELTSRGVEVIGGYLSPSHDAYINEKCKEEAIDALTRIRLCQELTASSDWLSVDPWEALYNEAAINFTEVLSRLERYLAFHLRTTQHIEVVYVFGSDNARFALSFIGRGSCVCVSRPGYEDTKYLARLAAYPKIIFSSQDSKALASRDLRPRYTKVTKELRLFLRDESLWAMQHWNREPLMLREAQQFLLQNLIALLQELPGVTVTTLSLQAQRQQAEDLTEQSISLDACIEGEHSLRISRCFALADSTASTGLVSRPGWPTLEQQVQQIPPGEYVLLDDDVSTGQTFAFAKALMQSAHHITRTLALCVLSPEPKSDLCDVRDFLVGSYEGGLVVRLPDGALARAPYLLPYVCPGQRCSIPVGESLRFSKKLWAVNRELFQKITPALCVRDALLASQQLWLSLGFSLDDTLEAVCQWHLERL